MKNTTWKIPLIILAAIIAIALSCVFMVQGSQNHAISLEEQVGESKAAINAQEKRRQDLVFNLADSVKAYDKHEADTLKDIVKERSSNTGKIESTGTAIAAVKEAYPELKSDKNYQRLMKELAVTENKISDVRDNYNQQIKEYNRYVKKFPTRVFLNFLGYHQKKYKYLEFEDATETAPQNLFSE
jgi:LemA protein